MRRLRAFGGGVLLVLAGLGAVAAAGVLPREQGLAAAGGAIAATMAAALALVVQPLFLRHAGRARSPGLQVQLALGLAFVCKLLALLCGVLVLVALGLKFPEVAAFAIAFAAASLLLSVCNAALLARGISRAAADLPARTDPSR